MRSKTLSQSQPSKGGNNVYDKLYKKLLILDEAMKSISGAAEGMLLAGGQTLLPTMKQRLASPDTLIDLSAVDFLHFR